MSHDAAPSAATAETRSPALPGVGSWALVTGASGGIGQAFARHLADAGVNVVLTGRRRAALDALASELSTETLVVEADMGDAASRGALAARIAEAGITVECLVNNAGFGKIGRFAEAETASNLEMVEVNCAAVVDLTQRYLPGMVEAHRGTVINVASTASFQPLPTMALYAATKSFVRSFTEGLWHELRGTGVHAIAICPGPTESGFFEVAGEDGVLTLRRTPEQVVATTFAGIARGVPSVVDGPLNKAQAVAPRFAPTKVALAIASRVMKPR